MPLFVLLTSASQTKSHKILCLLLFHRLPAAQYRHANASSYFILPLAVHLCNHFVVLWCFCWLLSAYHVFAHFILVSVVEFIVNISLRNDAITLSGAEGRGMEEERDIEIPHRTYGSVLWCTKADSPNAIKYNKAKMPDCGACYAIYLFPEVIWYRKRIFCFRHEKKRRSKTLFLISFRFVVNNFAMQFSARHLLVRYAFPTVVEQPPRGEISSSLMRDGGFLASRLPMKFFVFSSNTCD